MPSDAILEGLYKSKLQNSFQLQTVMALYDHEVARNNGDPNYQRLKTAVKLHIDQMMRTRNFRAGTMLWNEDQLPRVKEETKPTIRGKWESVFSGRHMDNVPKEAVVVSEVSYEKRRSSSPAPHSKAKQTNGEEQKILTGIRQ